MFYLLPISTLKTTIFARRMCQITALLVALASPAWADYRTDIDFDRLAAELGSALPQGQGVNVTQSEANVGDPEAPVYLPDPASTDLLGKTFNDRSQSTTGLYSSHATGVAGRFIGNNSSMTPLVSTVESYDADHWLGSGQLNGGSLLKPQAGPSRVGNHSWVGATQTAEEDSDLLRRADWLVDTDEFIQCVGLTNAPPTRVLLGSAYNVVAVGRSDGGQGTGSVQTDVDYPGGRVRPDVVAPQSTTSSATPVVCSTAVLLVDTGHSNPSLSTDPQQSSTQTRNGDTVYNAERSEVVKAALMAGADRVTTNTGYQNITDYRADPTYASSNGLDTRYGAGQVNVYNSYHVIAAGEQNSAEDGNAGGAVNILGFDYDPAFGGVQGSNGIATYRLSSGNTVERLYASLVWNMHIDGGPGVQFAGTATLYNLQLKLHDDTNGQQVTVSDGALDNTENLAVTLQPSHDYRIEVLPVSTQGAFLGDYALAWRLEPDEDGDGVRDGKDTCRQVANPRQIDSDGDGLGNFCDADFDHSGEVDMADVAALKVGFGQASPTPATDLNSDGHVDMQDVLLLRSLLYNAPGPGAADS